MNSPKQPISVLVVIHTSDLDVLLLERAAHPGFWQSVTGSREGDEALLATACREVGEETGNIAVVGQNVKLAAGTLVRAGEQRDE